MRIFIRALTIITLMIAFHKTQAQYIEFIENKGQWDNKIKFKGEISNGAIFLEQNGYKVLLNNPNDLEAVANYYGGHTASPKAVKTEDHALDQPVHATGGRGDKLVLHSHAYEVKFVGANPDPVIESEKPLPTYNNYFVGNDPSKWVSHCVLYHAVVYKNIYPNIDVRYYTDENKLKYDFIVNPGGDPSKIVMQFDGVDALSQKYGNLIIKNSVSDVTELAPVSYQLNVKERTKVKAQFVLNNNTVRFKIDNFSKDVPLIIDPALIFSTFSGSKSDNWGYTATYDGQGNFYMGGISFGPATGFPVSTGAFQTTFQGGAQEGSLTPYDAVLMKLSPDGSSRIYATYLGGSGNEQPHSLVVDNNGDLIVAGRTNSSDFPSTSDTYGAGGAFDIFITKFNPGGSAIIGSRRIGGTADDGVNIRAKYVGAAGAEATRRNYGDDARSEVIVDGANNIYLASCTQSDNFPVTSGAFQTKPGGKQDGAVIKANSDLSNIIFSSFLGGAEADAAFVLALNPADNDIYVAGGTVSKDFPGVGAGVLYSSYQGGSCDGFVSVISNNGSSLIRSSYFGTGGNEVVYGIQFDKFAFPYIMGTTTGTWPVVNAAFKQPNGKEFISKLKPDLSNWEYSTVFGKGQAAPDISPTAFLVDRCENVYVSGWGGNFEQAEGYPNANTTNLSVTPNAIQKATDGNDFYFFVLERNAAGQLYGSYFGERNGFGDHVDGGTSRFDKQGVIYQAICANCGRGGGVFPTTPGVWSTENQAQDGAKCNLAGIKIAFELAGVGAGLQASIEGRPRDTSGCVPLTVDFKDTLALGKTYKWDFGDGSAEQTTTTNAISHTYDKVGTYLVRLISTDSSTCNIADTAYTHIRVRNDRAVLGLNYAKLPPCESLSYQFNNTSTAPATKPFGAQSFIWDFGDGTTSTETNPVHQYAATGTYQVKLMLVDTVYCNAPDQLDTTIRIAPNVKAQFETPAVGCAPYEAVFNNTSEAGQTFTWDFGDGTTSNESSPGHVYKIPGNYTIKLVAVDPSTCNGIDSTSLTIVISAKPEASFSYLPQPSQENTFTTFTNNSDGANSYKWDFGDGEQLLTTKKDTTVRHIYDKSGVYNVCLIAYNQVGCKDTFCLPVQAIVVPVVDVANAFTPNGDGVNDVVSVQGYGISRMNWKIYNRWGALVFQSTSQKVPWDGKYKGVLQPQEVYAYVLDIEFSDGTKYQKKGDITLLR